MKKYPLFLLVIVLMAMFTNTQAQSIKEEAYLVRLDVDTIDSKVEYNFQVLNTTTLNAYPIIDLLPKAGKKKVDKKPYASSQMNTYGELAFSIANYKITTDHYIDLDTVDVVLRTMNQQIPVFRTPMSAWLKPDKIKEAKDEVAVKSVQRKLRSAILWEQDSIKTAAVIQFRKGKNTWVYDHEEVEKGSAKSPFLYEQIHVVRYEGQEYKLEKATDADRAMFSKNEQLKNVEIKLKHMFMSCGFGESYLYLLTEDENTMVFVDRDGYSKVYFKKKP